jgi:hypothetical protein
MTRSADAILSEAISKEADAIAMNWEDAVDLQNDGLSYEVSILQIRRSSSFKCLVTATKSNRWWKRLIERRNLLLASCCCG